MNAQISVEKKFDKKLTYITCPHCGREYLPAEIFYPNEFFGRPQDVERLNNGKIENFCGKTMNTEEEYICDGCLTKFKVMAKVTFTTKEISKYDMSKAYVTNLFEEKVSLSEDF